MQRRSGLMALVFAALVFGACDVKTDVTVGPSDSQATEERVAELEGQLADAQARSARLQRELATARETNVVSTGDEKFAFRINTPAALVLIFTVLAGAAVWIARIRYSS